MTGVVSQQERDGVIRHVAVPAAVSLALYFGSLLLPPLAMFSAAPLYYALAAGGPRAGLSAMAVCALAALAAGGAAPALLFLSLAGSTAYALYRMKLENAPLERTLGLSAMAPFASVVMVFASLAFMAGTSPEQVTQGWAREALAAMETSYRQAGVEAEFTLWLSGNAEALAGMVAGAAFGMAFAGCFVMTALNYAAIGALSRRYRWGIHFENHVFTAWRAPDGLVWALVAAGAAALLADGFAAAAGVNALIIAGVIYLFQGVAILQHYLGRGGVPPLLRALAYFLIFSQPALLALLAAVGVADLWADFRGLARGTDTQVEP